MASRRAEPEVPALAEILRPRMNDRYAVGEKIGTWRIFAFGEHELVAGHEHAGRL